MANKNLCIFILIATIVGQAIADDAPLESAGPGGGGGGSCGGVKEYKVGDCKGWGVKGFDYEGWAKGKEFYAGDKLVFTYPKGQNNVVIVDEDQYKKCTVPPGSPEGGSGKDTVQLDMGGAWFISGKNQDCQDGVKLKIDWVKCGNMRPKA